MNERIKANKNKYVKHLGTSVPLNVLETVKRANPLQPPEEKGGAKGLAIAGLAMAAGTTLVSCSQSSVIPQTPALILTGTSEKTTVPTVKTTVPDLKITSSATVPATVLVTGTNTPGSTIESQLPQFSPTAKINGIDSPPWQATLELQDPKDKYFKITSKVIDGSEVTQVTVDLYDTPGKESVVLVQESIKMMKTNDGLNPNILTALDSEGNKYAFNPEYGWFMVPEIQMDYADLTKYTEVGQDFFESGAANIATALKYAENPTISPDAIDPVYWVGYNNFKQVLTVCLNACGMEGPNYPEYNEWFDRMRYNVDTKPFAWTGFYKVHLKNGKIVYVIARTMKNPTEENEDRLVNLFNGFDQADYERAADIILGDGTRGFKALIDGVNRGGGGLSIILAPPEPFPFDPNTVHLMGNPNPDVASLQKRNELILLFDQEGQQIILKTLEESQKRGTHFLSLLGQSLPPELSRYILLTTQT